MLAVSLSTENYSLVLMRLSFVKDRKHKLEIKLNVKYLEDDDI